MRIRCEGVHPCALGNGNLGFHRAARPPSKLKTMSRSLTRVGGSRIKADPGNVTARHYLISEGHRGSDERDDDTASMETNSFGSLIVIQLLRARLMMIVKWPFFLSARARPSIANARDSGCISGLDVRNRPHQCRKPTRRLPQRKY